MAVFTLQTSKQAIGMRSLEQSGQPISTKPQFVRKYFTMPVITAK
jgi:hypothetical protein